MARLTNPIYQWGWMTRTNDFPVVITPPLITNAGFPGLVCLQTASALALTKPPNPPGVGSKVNITGFRRVNPRQPGLSGIYKIVGIIPPVAPATTPWIYALAETQGVAIANVEGVGQAAPLDLTFQQYFAFDTIRASGKKRGGRYGLSLGRLPRR